MNFNEKLNEYAKLAVRNGANVSKGQYVLISCPAETHSFAAMVAKEAFLCGAKDVITIFYDEKIAKLRYENADISVFENIPQWQAEQRNFYARNGCCIINIISDDPEAFTGVSSEKLMANAKAKDKAFKEFYDTIDKGDLRWTIVSHPCLSWAKKVFPNEPDQKAYEKLWDSIFFSCRICDNTTEKWHEHDEILKKRAKILNLAKFETLVYENTLGTKLKVGMPENHIWYGGSEASNDGISYFPNMPTEEIFTMPHRERTNGVVKSSMPLSYQGNIINNFSLTFKDGAVVDYSAEEGYEALKRLLETDEGSRRLGEVALVPYNSTISNLKILFYETLFDENASCHLALGSSYPNTIAGGEKLTKEELKELGGNDSVNHVDFMVGTSDLTITGITHDKKEIKIFENGNFAI